MRVLYIDLNAAYPQGLAGGHRSTHGLLARLARLPGCAAMTLAPRRGQGAQYPEYDPRPEEYESLGIRSLERHEDRWIYDCGYPVWVVDDVMATLDEAIADFEPEVVYCHSFVSMPLLEAARGRGLGAVWYLRDTRIEGPAMRRARALGVELIAVSEFLGAKARRAACEVSVIYSLIEPESYRVEPAPEGFVTFVNPHPLKGFETFLGFAERLPEVPFLVVEAWPLGPDLPVVEDRLRALPNVRFLPQQADARDIYRQTRLLVVPSVVEEGGPRVAREAQISGIPVLASANGGNGEVIGGGGMLIERFEDPAAWATAIRSVLGDTELYRSLSDAARQYVRRPEFRPREILDRFLGVCRRAATHRRQVAQMPGLTHLTT